MQKEPKTQTFEHCFYVKTKRFDFMFFANTRNERDILVHEINALSDNKNAEVEVMSARQNVMNDINNS